jgi:hypothetical protein
MAEWLEVGSVALFGLFGELIRKIQMILLTANRRMKGEDSREQVLPAENTADAFPVITIGAAD